MKYGARASQIETTRAARLSPKYARAEPGVARTDEPRWMNRRVALTVTDDQGRTIGAGGAGDAIRALTLQRGGAWPDCCSEVLKRLDKLDDIDQMLKDLADQNAALRDELAGLKADQDALRDQLAGLRQGRDNKDNRPRRGSPCAARSLGDGSRQGGQDRARPEANRRISSCWASMSGPTSNGDVTYRQRPLLRSLRRSLRLPGPRRVLL